jgi:hypothetical protein
LTSEKPTLIVDEADDLFARKTDVKHIFNASWTRGTKIPRQMQGMTHWFDPFCPKVVGLLGMKLPRTLVGRSIVIKLWPKRPDEKVDDFSHADDQEFANLRRKLARWAADNAAALKDATPLMPANFRNRLAANWRLPFAIAELAGGVWPKPARQAAERLSRPTRTPSLGLQLLAAIRDMFAIGRMEITSRQVVNDLNADPDGIWREYRGKSPITQRQVADLLEQYDIRPVVVHPTSARTFHGTATNPNNSSRLSSGSCLRSEHLNIGRERRRREISQHNVRMFGSHPEMQLSTSFCRGREMAPEISAEVWGATLRSTLGRSRG